MQVVSVTVPAVTEIGKTASLSWSTKNLGTATAVHGWQDAVYLSQDGVVDATDTLLGTVLHTTDLPVNGSQGSTLNVVLPAVIPGNYQVIVVSDRWRAVPESIESNNEKASSQFPLNVPLLRAGDTLTGTLSGTGDFQYYRLPLLAGQTIRLRLDESAGETELLVCPGALPTPSRFSQRVSVPGGGQELTLTSPQDGDYFVAVRNISMASVVSVGFTLKAEALAFGLTSLGQQTADRGGRVTLRLNGTEFDSSLGAMLRDNLGHQLSAADILVISPSEAYASFDLTALPVGTFDLTVVRTLNELTAHPELPFDDPGFFTVSPHTQTATLTNALSVTAEKPDDLKIQISAPSVVRPGRIFEVIVTVSNGGTHDLKVPLLSVNTSDPDAVIAPARSLSSSYLTQGTYFLPISGTGYGDIIRPGQSVDLRFTLTTSLLGEIEIKATAVTENASPMSYDAFVDMLDEDPASVTGLAIVAKLTAKYGTSVASWAEGLRSQVHFVNTSGLPTVGVVDLMRLTASATTPTATLTSTIPQAGMMSADAIQTSSTPPGTPDLTPLQQRFEKLLEENPLEALRYDLFNYATGRPGEPLTEQQLHAREVILKSLAAFLAGAGAPTGSFHLNRFLGDFGPTPAPGGLGYFEGDTLTSGIRATGRETDWGYGAIKLIVDLAIKELVQAKARDLPEGESEISFDSEITSAYRFLLQKLSAASDYYRNTGQIALWTYVNGGLSFFSNLLDPQTAIGRVEGTAIFHGTAKKTVDGCGHATVTYKGDLQYTFPDVYRFGGDGGRGLNLVLNTYAEELQRYGWAGQFNVTVTMKDKTEGAVSTSAPKTADHCPRLPDLPGQDFIVKPRVVLPFDPNEIVGPSGAGAENFLPPNRTSLPYTIRFENDPTKASAPAQEVMITHQLDADLDWSSFELGQIGFGDQVIDIPAGLQSYQTQVSYHNQDGSPLLVNLDATFNPRTGLLKVTYRSVDPATGELPNGVFDGFLPVDDDTGRGEGFVQYTVLPKSGLVSGTKFTQQASIVFDTNAPIVTNTFSNTIDATSPSSAIKSLSPESYSQNVTLNWTGADNQGGSGVAFYDIYVSDNNGPYVLFLQNTKLTSSVFAGAFGHDYRFYSVATDNVGQRESTPVSPDAHTTLIDHGNVTLSSSGKKLLLQGDDRDNSLEIDQLQTAHSFLLQGLNGTRLDGGLASLNRTASQIVVTLGPGTDKLVLKMASGSTREINATGEIRIKTVSGDYKVKIKTPKNNALITHSMFAVDRFFSEYGTGGNKSTRQTAMHKNRQRGLTSPTT
ncbi:MAG: CARDB domain-containing protein [Planctomycetales bacterium]